MAELLVYGSYGYTGELIVEEATARGLDPILAGRNEHTLSEQAAELNCEMAAFEVDDYAAVTHALDGVDAVLNCAGPFVETYEPMVEAAIESGTHYLDITGEIDVFRAVADYDDRAVEADVMCMSGVGFDVVPTDCLAAHLHERRPEATHLALAFKGLADISPGTMKTMLNYAGDGGYVRRDGLVESVPAAYRTRRIDFGSGERSAVTIPWGDVVTGYHTTGIHNIEVYIAVPEPAIWAMRGTRPVAPLLDIEPVKTTLESVIDTAVTGPGARTRERGRGAVWGEVSDEDGGRAVSRLETPETYELTVESALEIAERVLDGDAPVGYQTPAGAYGPDLVLDLPGVEREDVR
ncbi:saccharopine dehydrogenase family protein [Halorientalis sp.]|uniref:saccharopine dehydrogenase family protein n=1 Tax=Halorientalis sp. TaxID=1931229 RepID=UPI0026398544|nr:saccharopine dehydrogenase NADP-binding domain-containing protein [Halorientalis sp.]